MSMKTRFRSISIKEKIALSMNGIILMLLLLVYAISIIFFSAFIKNDTYASYSNLVDNIGLRLDYHYKSIISYIISIHSNVDFISLASDFDDPDIPRYQKQIEAQPFISGLINSSSLVEQAVIIDSNGTIYSNFTLGMNNTGNVAELRDSGSIRLIPYSDHSFVVNQSEVMPLIIPIYEIDKGVFSFSGTNAQYKYSFILFIPYTALSKLLRNDLKSDLVDFSVTNSDGDTVIESGRSSRSKGSYALSLPLFNGIGELHVLLSNQRIHSRILTLSLLMILQSIIILLLAAFLIIRISGLLVRPIRILTKIVRRIETGSYLRPYTIHSDDEIGVLCTAINQMHETIQTQIEHITVSEEEKYNLKMKLITEQIKPHFLYNTFEYINAEIESGHNENASRMLMTLTEYLRLGLNNGEETSTIANEISHADAYLKIMNSRFHSRIRMVNSIPEEYSTIRMPKMLLQPLIENSIKHGFKKTSILGMIETPEIEISLSREDHRYTLIIADNGAGIDKKRAEDALNSESISQHIGLQNIYQRLLLLYPDTAIKFTSIPFYRNEVIISFSLT